VVSRHFSDIDSVFEFDALDNFRQLVFAFEVVRRVSGRKLPLKASFRPAFCRVSNFEQIARLNWIVSGN
jgi:hypothetical protein